MAAEVLNSSSVPRLNFCAKLNIFASISATTPIPETLAATLSDNPSATLSGQDEGLKINHLLWLYYKKEIPYIHFGAKI